MIFSLFDEIKKRYLYTPHEFRRTWVPSHSQPRDKFFDGNQSRRDVHKPRTTSYQFPFQRKVLLDEPNLLWFHCLKKHLQEGAGLKGKLEREREKREEVIRYPFIGPLLAPRLLVFHICPSRLNFFLF